MTKPQRKYNKICSFGDCGSWMADGDIFCKPHYWSLPEHMRKSLWRQDPRQLGVAIKAAVQWLKDKENNALIVKEEGP